jgi:hypothetical protein
MTKALIADSLPQIFYDPPEVQARRARRRMKGKAKAPPTLPKAPPNPARLAGDQLRRFMAIPGWQNFALTCANFQSFTGTPGWEDQSFPPKKTVPDAKPIDLASWGSALATAGLVAIHGELPLPDPGIDPLGFIWLYWDIGDAQFALELHRGAVAQTYKWRRVVDGTPRPFEATALEEVIVAIKAFHVEAKRGAAVAT